MKRKSIQLELAMYIVAIMLQPALATVGSRQMHVQLKHPLAHLQDLIPSKYWLEHDSYKTSKLKLTTYHILLMNSHGYYKF